MSNLSVFNFNESEVRIQLVNNEPLFCLTDVTSILKVKNAHASRFNFNLSGVHKMYTPTYNQHGTEVKQELTFINEPNLYRVIFRSNKKEAVDFQNWVFDEVLPTIRKTGSYSLTINTEQQQAIKQAVNERAYRTGEHYQAIYSKLYEQFKIPRYQDLPSSKFDDAIKFLGGISTSSKLSDENWYDIAWLYKAAEHMRFNCERILPALQAINSSYYSEFWSLAKDHKHALEYARIIIERETAHISDKGFTNKWNRVLPVIRQPNQLR